MKLHEILTGDKANELISAWEQWWGDVHGNFHAGAKAFQQKFKKKIDEIIDQNFENIEWGDYTDYDEPDLIDEHGDAAVELAKLAYAEFYKSEEFKNLNIPAPKTEEEAQKLYDILDDDSHIRNWAYDLGYEYAKAHGLQQEDDADDD